MPSRKERLCCRCGFPARRGTIPIIWGDSVYCSVSCFERCEPGGTPGKYPEPFRTMQIEAEDRGGRQ